MKYVSIDIETAGLGRECSLLEFGAVLDDLSKPEPLEGQPQFHTYFLSDGKITGEPYALAMHQKILDRIAKHEKPWQYMFPRDLNQRFYSFLEQHGYKANEGKIEITVAGKNFAMFDRDWLMQLFSSVQIHHRVIDPAMLYFKIGDITLPSSKECMKRAGMEGEVAHTAVEDALMVCNLLRRHYYH